MIKNPYQIKRVYTDTTTKYMVYRNIECADTFKIEGLFVSKPKAEEFCRALNNELQMIYDEILSQVNKQALTNI